MPPSTRTSTVSAADPSANAHVKAAIDRAIFFGGELGIQVAAYRHGRLIVDTWSGVAHPDGRPVDGMTLFNVYSVSKAVAATAVHVQAERGLLDYEAPIATYWPEFGARGKDRATVRDALTHRTGVPYMPEGTTPEAMCDWDRMCDGIAASAPSYPVGGDPAYHSVTFGWILGEIVRRTDPARRPFGRYVEEEIARPLGITDLWFGLPDRCADRVATLRNDNAADKLPPEDSPFIKSVPYAVQLVPEVFSRPDVQRACIPAVGGIYNARSEARFWAMLANSGSLDGVRLLSSDRVATFPTPRPGTAPDPVYFGIPMPLSNAGFWLGAEVPLLATVKNPKAICCPGAGGSIGWADPETGVAVAICHNRMLIRRGSFDQPLVPVADAIREVLGL
jgi:CubicO group peptidase (beta-lactamase class C family)